jgi:hypothetical protein
VGGSERVAFRFTHAGIDALLEFTL